MAHSGDGVSGPFRDGLAQRGRPDIGGVTDERVVFTAEPQWDAPTTGTGGRPRRHHRLAEGSPRPVSLKPLAERTPVKKGTWREGTQGPMSGRFAWRRVGPGQGWATGDCDGADPIWRRIEPQSEGTIKDAGSNLPAHPSRLRGVAVAQPLAAGAGLPAEEGGAGTGLPRGPLLAGFHHHACRMRLAAGFLALDQRRMKQKPTPAGRGKRGINSRSSRGRRSAGRSSGCWGRCVGVTAHAVGG